MENSFHVPEEPFWKNEMLGFSKCCIYEILEQTIQIKRNGQLIHWQNLILISVEDFLLMALCYETFSHKEFKYKYFVKLNYSFSFCFWRKTFTILEKNFNIKTRMLKK